MRKNKILSVIGGLAAFIFTSCDGIFDVDYYTFLPEDYIFTNESTIEEGLLGCYELLYPNSFGGSAIFPFCLISLVISSMGILNISEAEAS